MNRKHRRSDKQKGKPYFNGLIAMIGTMGISLILGGFLLTQKDISPQMLTIINGVILFLGCFIGSYVCCKQKGTEGLKTGGIFGLGLFVLIFVVGVITHGLQFNVITLIKLMICLIGGTSGGIFGVNKKAKRKIKSL
jgi:putative membrane protein (TIGR04086 family)